MKDKDLETRNKILKYTLELVQNEKDFSKITVRRIIAGAGVSLSAVNYHFGSKEKLINEVISTPIRKFLSSQADPYADYKDDAIKKLKELVKLPARYLAENPNISRISILNDMMYPIENDLTEQTINFLIPAFKDAFPGRKEEEIKQELWNLISVLQTAFLRHHSFCKLTGVDFFNGKERNKFLEDYIDMLIKKNGGVVNG